MLPVLYTFRRCPYAMRARWAIEVAGVAVDMREIALRDKPAPMLAASPKGTVPVLVLRSGEVIDESLNIMRWALAQRDPEGWLTPERGTLDDMLAWIDACEADFKPHLDRSKYALRYRAEWACDSGADAADEAAFSERHRALALQFLERLAAHLAATQSPGAARANPCDETEAICPGLFGARAALADVAIVPFVRQFARMDEGRFAEQAPTGVANWMRCLLARADFGAVMTRRALWRAG